MFSNKIIIINKFREEMESKEKMGIGKSSLMNLSHIGIVVKDIEKTIGFLSSVWGIGKQEIILYEPEKKDLIVGEPFGLRIVHIKFGPVFIELLQPTDNKSIWSKFIEEHGEGVHHFAFGVSNYDEIIGKFEKQGNKCLAAAVYFGVRWCYYKTNTADMVIEFREEYV